MANKYPYVFAVEGQRFRVNRLSPLDGFRIWHRFRNQLAKTHSERAKIEITEIPEGWPDGDAAWVRFHEHKENAAWLDRRFMQLPAEYLEELRADMFEIMEAELKLDDKRTSWEPLNDVVETVFSPLDAYAVTEVAVRSFFFVFARSFNAGPNLYFALLKETPTHIPI